MFSRAELVFIRCSVKPLVSDLLIGTMLVVIACGRPDAKPDDGSRGPLSRVFIDSAGGIAYNGKPVSEAALADSLRALAALGGGIIYSRANAQGDPSAVQEPVMRRTLDAIIANKLPVRLVPPESLATAGR